MSIDKDLKDDTCGTITPLQPISTCGSDSVPHYPPLPYKTTSRSARTIMG